ncbi:LytR C-terminal domain-containing protein [Corynebacterium singulare]|uniref:LytR C-terminal domain-containing protein n=1 Tax=Corynebacterium singulare TaxID=161899 RepID=UPI00119FD324|nr:LytR C-terminal domain-containing protein [Corynebacterium singulare]
MTNVNPENSASSVNGARPAADSTDPAAAGVNPDARAGDPVAAPATASAAAPAEAPSAEPVAAGTDAGAAAAPATKLPVRGLAMVLIAVAVMLGMWALYAMTSDNSENVAEDGGNNDSAVSGPANGGAEGEGQGGQAGAGNKDAGAAGGAAGGDADKDGNAAGSDAKKDSGKDADAAGGDADAGQDAAAEGDDAAERDGAAADREQADIPVNVYNNSGRANFAADEAERLKSQNFKVSEVGNLSGEVLVAPQTTVYYPEGDAAAENLAKELAAQYYGGSVPGGAIAPYPAELIGDYTKGDAVVVVLAVPQA